jgi:hypothetical protein
MPNLADQWRVEIRPAGGEGATLLCFVGVSEVEYFDSPDDLPQWVKERIAVLDVMSDENSTNIEGIGEKMLTNIYWVDVPTGIVDELGYNLTEEKK